MSILDISVSFGRNFPRPTYLYTVPTIPPPIAPFIVTTADLVQTSFCVNCIIWYCCFPSPIQYLLVTKWKVTIRNKSGIKKGIKNEN